MRILFLIFIFAFVVSLQADPYAIRRYPGRKASEQKNQEDILTKDADEASGENSEKTERTIEEIKFRLPKGVRLNLVRIPAGTFIFSAADGQNWNREKEVRVTLKKDYYLGVFEITQAQYLAVIGLNPSQRKKGWFLPVENVSWNDAMYFCDKLTQAYAPKGWKFTLPTECQWEYAARAGASSEFTGTVQPKMRHRKTRGGYAYSGSNNLEEVGWYDENSSNHTHPVGQKRPNDFGLYDMSGNVWEWCLDDWTNDSRTVVPEFYRGNDKDFRSPRTMRGGGYRNVAKYCRVAFRQHKEASFRYRSMGFRVALVQLPGNTNLHPTGNFEEEEK